MEVQHSTPASDAHHNNTPVGDANRHPRKWSRLSQLAKGAAIAQCNRERAKHNGVRWSAREMKIVQETYPDYQLMMKRLPHRNLTQLKKFAYCYGIAKKRHVWTNTEIAIIKRSGREGWSKAQLCESLPHLAPSQIVAQFRQCGCKFKSVPRELGVLVLDEIRQRARGMNLSLADLDAISGGGVYWKNCLRKPNWKRIAKVVEFMGGRLRAEFAEFDENADA